LQTEYWLQEQGKMEQNQNINFPKVLPPNMKNRKKDISRYFNFDFSKIRNLFKLKTAQFQLIYSYER
jgi:hypothetical protein